MQFPNGYEHPGQLHHIQQAADICYSFLHADWDLLLRTPGLCIYCAKPIEIFEFFIFLQITLSTELNTLQAAIKYLFFFPTWRLGPTAATYCIFI